MRSTRPLRLEALEGRFAPTDLGLIDPISVTMPPPPDVTQTTTTTTTTTTTDTTPDPIPDPPPDNSGGDGSIGDLMDPIGTPIDP